MTTITTYAVLTAVLFTLGFVTIDNAQAEKVSYDQALEMLDQIEAEISIKDSISDEDVKALKRTELLKELITYDQYRDAIPEKYNTSAIDNRIDDILNQINGKYASSNVMEAEVSLAPDNLAFGYGTDWDTWPNEYNCSIQANDAASNDGVQSWITGTGMFYWWSFDYPSSMSHGTIPCPAEDYEEASAIIQSWNSPTYPVCTLTWSYNWYATIGALCNNGDYENALALVTTNAFYDNGVEYKQEFSIIAP